MTSNFITVVLSSVIATPPYHYTGVMYPPNSMWTMFEPYAEYEVGQQLCRAAKQPRCTWWNAMAITTANDTIFNEDTPFYSDIPFFPSGLTQFIFDVTETNCILACYTNATCTAAMWERNLDICLLARDAIVNPIPINASITVPTTRWYIKKNKTFSHNRAIAEVDRMLKECDCFMDTFRCPRP